MDFRVRFTMPRASMINSEIEKILGRKAESITHNEDLRYLITQSYLDAVTPFVPMRHNDLRESAYRIAGERGKGRITWSATRSSKNWPNFNYAYKQYHTQYDNYTTTGTGSHWVEKVHPRTGEAEWQEYIRSITPLIREAYKNG